MTPKTKQLAKHLVYHSAGAVGCYLIIWTVVAFLTMALDHFTHARDAFSGSAFWQSLITTKVIIISLVIGVVVIIVVELYVTGYLVVSWHRHRRYRSDHSQWLSPAKFVKIMPPHRLFDQHSHGWIATTKLKRSSLMCQAQAGEHGLIIGSTGSGKTQKLILPTILYNACAATKPSMVISDPKGKLADQCQAFLRQQGYDVQTCDFSTWANNNVALLRPIVRWWQAKKYAQAEQAVSSLATILIRGITSKSDPVWHLGAKNLLGVIVMTALAEAEAKAAYQRVTLSYLYQISCWSMHKMQQFIDAYALPHPFLQTIVGHVWDDETPRFLQTIKQLVVIATQNFKHITTQPQGNLVIEEQLRAAPTAVFIKTHLVDKTYWNLSTIFLATLFNFLLSQKTGDDRPVLFILDEFGNIPPIPNFCQLVATAREYNMWFLLTLQSYEQLRQYEGHHDLIANCGLRFFFHTSDLKTARAVEQEYGYRIVTQKNVHISSATSKKSTTTYQTKQPLISYYQLMKLHNQIIIKTNHDDPVLVTSTSFFKIQQWLQKHNPAFGFSPEEKLSNRSRKV